MSEYETEQELTMEDRLKAIAYQFIALYERWSEDRQVAAKQGADAAELIKKFIEQVNQFKLLEPRVRQELVSSIQSAASSSFEKMGESIGKEATRATEKIANQLGQVTEKTEQTLKRYEENILTSQWLFILVTVVTTVVTCLLIVWLLIPKPTLPLTDEQIVLYQEGKIAHKY